MENGNGISGLMEWHLWSAPQTPPEMELYIPKFPGGFVNPLLEVLPVLYVHRRELLLTLDQGKAGGGEKGRAGHWRRTATSTPTGFHLGGIEVDQALQFLAPLTVTYPSVTALGTFPMETLSYVYFRIRISQALSTA